MKPGRPPGTTQHDVDCPKCRNIKLLPTPLKTDDGGEIMVHRCPKCEGQWISRADYRRWQQTRPPVQATPQLLNQPGLPPHIPSKTDARAALCPECRRYLSRAKVEYVNPFFLERCAKCEGFWFDRGEWAILDLLGVSGSLEQFFDQEWQMNHREQSAAERERKQLVERLGEDLANQIMTLAETLQAHPYGDFALAYLVRKAAQNKEVQTFQVGQGLNRQ